MLSQYNTEFPKHFQMTIITIMIIEQQYNKETEKYSIKNQKIKISIHLGPYIIVEVTYNIM